MRVRGCLSTSMFAVLFVVIFGVSSFFSFRLFVRGRSIPAPELIGLTLSDARAEASDAGLVLEVDNKMDRNADQVPFGAVAWQNRDAGSYVKRGTRLIVGQSLGPLVLRVPDLTGESARTALLRFSQRNLQMGTLSYFPSAQPGIVAADPPAGTVVEGQTPVSLLVGFATPPPPYVMPDLINRPIDRVTSAFNARNLSVTNIRYETYPGIQDGTIIRQFPLPGSPVRSGDAITLVVTRQQEEGVITQ